MPNEVEVKLAAPLTALAAIGRLRTLGDFRLRPRRAHALHTVYLDTATHALARAGVALRLRRDGRRWEATAKWPGRVDGTLHARPELNVALPGEPLLPFVLPDGPLRDQLRALVLDRPLLAVLITAVRRRPLDLLPARGQRVLAEVALDHVQLCAADGTPAAPPYAEVEIETRHGDAGDCLAVGRLLTKQFDLTPSPATKYARGLSAVYGDAAPRRRGGRDLTGGEPLATALRSLIATQLERLRAADPETRGGQHAEPLHEMRVALRRIRTALRAFRTALPARELAAVLRELAWLGQELGQVRDLDVQLGRIAAHRDQLAADAGLPLDAYRRHLQQERRRRRAALAVTLDSRRARQLLLSLEHVANAAPPRGLPARATEPFAQAARRAVRKALRRLRQRGAVIGELPDTRDLHALRIRAKRLRYVLEALRPIAGAPARRLIAQVVKLQDALGAFNDAIVAVAALRAYRDQLAAGSAGSAASAAIDVVADAELRRAGVAQANFHRAWRRFADKTKRRQRRLLLTALQR
ncbi:MAG: CHAD domain-containing protein [bacterium]